MPKRKTILMCAPTYFDIEYEINPWMHTDNPVSHQEAGKQWQSLYTIYTQKLGWDVQLVEPIPHLPDMVFTANGGLVYGGKVVLPQFRQADRQGETEHFKDWFTEAGYGEMLLPKYDFEGEGDALFWNDILFAGYPWRSDLPSHKEVADFLGVKVISLQLADARFYHLDTALTIISEDTVALYPAAFDELSLKKIHDAVPNVIEASANDAEAYGLNAMSDGQDIVISDRATGLIELYKNKGLSVHPTPISEYQKSGGGVKCLTLEIRN
jgi:N-dimethylarginine dimethylaminohydrolase